MPSPSPFRAGALGDLLANVRARPGRTLVSMGGIFAGTAVLMAMLAIGGGLRERADRLVRDFGADVLMVAGTARSPLRCGDPELLRTALGGAVVAGVRTRGAPTVECAPAARVLAVDPDWIRARPIRLLAGRFLDASDCFQREPHAVADADLCRALGAGLGATVRTGTRSYTLCGMTGAGATTPDSERAPASGGLVLMIPRAANEAPDAICIRGTGPGGPAAARLAAERVLAGTGRPPASLDWITPDVLVRETQRLRRTIGAAAGAIAALCLVSGLATLASLMLVGVRERYVEIGLRRALGATPADVALAFVAEGMLVAGGAAAAAVALGTAVLLRWGPRLPVPATLDGAVAAIPLVAAFALGAAAAAAAAWRAARLHPAEALRAE